MKIHVYSFSWNESAMLPYFLRYYEKIADCMIFYDNGSTDGTLELLKKYPKVKVVHFEIEEESAFKTSGKIRNEMWKESRGKADWAIVCDVDEIIYHPDNLKNFLKIQRKLGCTLVQANGYEMISDKFPTTKGQIYDEIKMGAKFPKYDKTIILNPNYISETNFNMGSHKIEPKGRVKWSENRVYLLHYKFLGMEYLLKRYEQLRSGFKRRDPPGWGMQWQRSEDEVRYIFSQRKKEAVNVFEEMKK